MYYMSLDFVTYILADSLEGLNSRFEQSEERMRKLKDRSVKMIKSEEQKEKRMK